jgi:hypothetical protein
MRGSVLLSNDRSKENAIYRSPKQQPAVASAAAEELLRGKLPTTDNSFFAHWQQVQQVFKRKNRKKLLKTADSQNYQ